MNNVLLTVLAHHDLPRFERAMTSAENVADGDHEDCFDFIAVINTLDDEFRIKAMALCEEKSWPYSVTNSNGLPGKGKNSVIDDFLETGFGYLCQLDGDDFFYPCAAEAITEAITYRPDAVALIPLDVIDWSGDVKVWTSGTAWPDKWVPGPGAGVVTRGRGALVCAAMTRLLSRKAAMAVRYEEHVACGEDHLHLMELFRLHKERKLNLWTSMAIDWMVVDRTTEGSVQDVHAADDKALREHILQRHHPRRTNLGELPMMFPSQHMDWRDKHDFATSRIIETSTKET